MVRDIIRSVFRRPQQEEATASQEVFALVLVVCVIALFVWWYDRVNTARWDILQQLLQLPPGIERSRFSPARVDKSFEEVRSGTAEAKFSEAQLRDFIRMIDGSSTAGQGPSSINRVRVISYSPRSLAWMKPPLTDRVGNWPLRPDGLLPASGTAADMRVFCLVFQDPRAWNDPSPRLVYLARACSELGPKESADRVVVAVMDISTRTLRIRVE